MQTRQFPAASIAVVKDGTVVLAKGYGLSDVEKSIKATEQTVYQLASVTKPFTAMAILMLVEDGKLSLDGKITEILPGLPAAWAPVTVRHLLSHTSGIKSYTDVFGEKKVAGEPGVHGRRRSWRWSRTRHWRSRRARSSPTATPATTCSG